MLEFLRDDCGIGTLTDNHSYSQGEVIKAVFEKGQAEVGIVDEDPGKPHHRLRDRTTSVRNGIDVDLRELGGKRLFLVKPDLEECFLRAMARVGQTSRFGTASRMHRILGVSASKEHSRFKKELATLRQVGTKKKILGFLSELEHGLRDLVSRS